MEYKIIDLVFPILVHFLALQLTGILGIGDAAFQTMLAAVITMPLFFWLYRKDQNLWRKEKRKITWIQWIIVIAAAAGLNILFSALMSFLVSDYGITSESQDALLTSRMLFQILGMGIAVPVSYTHLRAHETDSYLVCRLLLEKKKKTHNHQRLLILPHVL